MRTLFLVLLLGRCSVVASAQQVVTTSANMDVLEKSEAAEVAKIRRIIRSLGPRASAPAQLIQLTRDIDDTVAARAFLEVADEYFRQGEPNLAANVLSHLLEHYPQEEQVDQATLLLLRLYSSGEMAHSQYKAADSAKALRLPLGWARQAEQSGESPQQRRRRSLLTYSTHLARRQTEKFPRLAKQPEFAFQCAVAARIGQHPAEAKSWLTIVKHKREFARWRKRAQVEAWLMEHSLSEPPLPVVHFQQAESSPHLDGVLDDSCWRNAQPAAVSTTDSAYHSELIVAGDSEYCYLAGRAEKLAGIDYAADSSPRTYDANLSKHDRLEILLDIDRDYATSYRLTVDHRGWTNDACWLDRTWNPKWYVAAGDGPSWTFEAAIPWSELAESPPTSDDAWAIAVRRLSPLTESKSELDYQILRF